MENFKYPGQFEVDGVVYDNFQCGSSLEKIKNELQLDGSDIVVATYPRSGTHWMMEIVHHVDVGPTKARTEITSLDEYGPYLEVAGTMPGQESTYDELHTFPKPWRMRTHLNSSYFERFLKQDDGPKIIYMIRNPKDILMSYHRIHADLSGLGSMSWEAFWDLHNQKRVLLGYLFDHQLGWWRYRDHSNLLIVHYEDLLSDPAKEITRVAAFIGRSYSDKEIQQIVDNTSFVTMASRPTSAYFAHCPEEEQAAFGTLICKGQTGYWKGVFTDEQNAYIDHILKTRTSPEGLFYRF